MASDTGGSDPPPQEWLMETSWHVHRTLLDASRPAQLGERLPDAFLSAPLNRFAWIGTSADGGVRIRATPEGVDLPAWLDSGGDAGLAAGIRAVETTGEIQVEPADHGSLERELLQESTGIPEAATRVWLPLVVDEESYGVVHLYTDAEASTPPVPEMLSTLGRTIAERFSTLEAKSQLRRERRRLETFRSLVSHDLGNPLNIASGRLELAQDDCENSQIDYAVDAIERIESLIDEGLRFVEVGKPPNEREERSLASLCPECWADVAGDRGTLEVEDVPVVAEPERLRMLFHELFENAVVHADGEVEVSVGPRASGDGFYVEDTGPGIPADEREYVFDMGYTTTERPGNGLTVVREIADAHGWEVQLGDRDEGTRIEVLTDRW